MEKPYEVIKRKLITIIKEMSASPWLFVKDPGRDFTRKRKLSFETMIRLLLGMGGRQPAGGATGAQRVCHGHSDLFGVYPAKG